MRQSKSDLSEKVAEENEAKREKWYWIVILISLPFFIAGIGTIAAGVILGNVQHWRVFNEMHELFILVPPICGLKGNLDMCVAARLTTHSNLGQLRDRSNVQSIVVGNLALVQAQAIVCSFILACGTILVVFFTEGKFNFHDAFILIAAAMFTASTSCFILDTVLLGVIVFSQRYNFNPDYMATPIVASIGDVSALCLLSFSAALMNDLRDSYVWIGGAVLLLYALLLPIWCYTVWHNKYTRDVLLYGWCPVLGALMISICGGIVLSGAVEHFLGFAVFSPIINGVGGNLVSIQACSMTTILYLQNDLGTMPNETKICVRPDRTLFWGTPYARIARLLMIISIPGNVILILIADYLFKSCITLTFDFIIMFVATSLILLLILLWAAHVIVHFAWKIKVDPDSSSIPYLTAIGDVLGTALLYLMFIFLESINREYQDKSKPLIKIASLDLK